MTIASSSEKCSTEFWFSTCSHLHFKTLVSVCRITDDPYSRTYDTGHKLLRVHLVNFNNLFCCENNKLNFKLVLQDSGSLQLNLIISGTLIA